jgi:hypothetical protein
MQRSHSTIPVLRSLIVGAVGAAAALVLAPILGHSYPVSGWLAWPVLTIWFWQIVLAASCVCFGEFILTAVLKCQPQSELETIALAAPVGVVSFTMGMYVGGFLGLYGPLFAISLPVTMLGVSLPVVVTRVRKLIGRPASAAEPRSTLVWILWGFGVVMLAFLYLGIFSPDSLGYDATWNHMVTAQDYAREGRIVPLPGDWQRGIPHLASIMYAWGFMVPGLAVPALKWMMALHIEFTLFVGTLVAVGALVNRLARRPVQAGWVVLFVFPSLFVRDSELSCASDHVAGFFSAPLFLMVLITARSRETRHWFLLAVISAGAILTKLQMVFMIVPAVAVPTIVIALDAIRAARRKESDRIRQLLRGPAVALGSLLVLTAPHFVKNVVYYGNPFYPFMQSVFPSHPGFPGAASIADETISSFGLKPPQEFRPRLDNALRLLVTFSFYPRHGTFGIGDRSYLGSLFTFLLPVVPFLRRPKFILLGASCGLAMLFLWGWTYPVDRNLQTFVPVLAAVVGATLAEAVALGWLASVGVATLVACQIIGSSDLLFSTFDRCEQAAKLIRSGIEGKAATRFDGYRKSFIEVGQALPQDAVVVLHNSHPSLGIDRRLYLDWGGYQGLFDGHTFKTPLDLYNRWKELGVTHFVFQRANHPTSTKQEEVIYAAYLDRFAGPTRHIGEFEIVDVRANPPPQESPYEVVMLDVGHYPDGLYRVDELSVWEDMPSKYWRKPNAIELIGSPQNATQALSRCRAAVVGSGYASVTQVQPILSHDFIRSVSYASYTVYLRR